jgi:hypothetical protein
MERQETARIILKIGAIERRKQASNLYYETGSLFSLKDAFSIV